MTKFALIRAQFAHIRDCAFLRRAIFRSRSLSLEFLGNATAPRRNVLLISVRGCRTFGPNSRGRSPRISRQRAERKWAFLLPLPRRGLTGGARDGHSARRPIFDRR